MGVLFAVHFKLGLRFKWRPRWKVIPFCFLVVFYSEVSEGFCFVDFPLLWAVLWAIVSNFVAAYLAHIILLLQYIQLGFLLPYVIFVIGFVPPSQDSIIILKPFLGLHYFVFLGIDIGNVGTY